MFRRLTTAAFIAAAWLGASAIEVPPPSVVLQGVMVSNENWTSTADAGIYNIEVRPGGTITCQQRNSAMAAIVAAINHNGTLYAIESDFYSLYYRQYSTTTWTAKGSREEIDAVNLPSDLTYDPVTGKVYGGFWSDDYGGYSRFCSFGLGTAEASDVKGANRDERDIFAVAATPDGTVYALFGAFNYLATISTKNGALERIGKTGLDIDANASDWRVNSMVYDSANDRLLASVYHYTGPRSNPTHYSALYSINPHTAEAEKIMDFPGAACFAGLSILSDQPSATAPAAPTNITPGDGFIEFDVPSTSVGGAPLSGTLIAIINVNGTETVSDGLVPGTRSKVDGLTFVNGENTVRVTLCTADERGETATITFRNGEDIPAAVTNLTLNIADGKALLCWDAPGGANGGTIKPENLRYRIVRYPDSKTVAEAHTSTSFTDDTLDPKWKSLYYTVTAYNKQGESAAATSNRCPASGAITVPYTETFDTADDFAAWSVVDLNGSATWKYDSSKKAAIYDFPRDATPGDDWLISPPIAIAAGKTYKLSYDYRAYSKSYKESFEVALVDGSKVSEATVLGSHLEFNHTNYEHGEAIFKADADGTTSVAFHATSKPNMWSIYIDNVVVEVIDSHVPAEAANLTVTPAAEGALKASINFTAPSADTEGTPLVALTKIEVRRSGSDNIVATIDSPAPGENITVEDNAVSASGIYTYSVVCFNGAGSSLAAQVQVFVGIDAPGAVGNLTISEKDSHPYLEWTAPIAGANGGWFDKSSITYRIVRSDGTVVAEKCTDLFFTDLSYTSPKAAQDALWYLVTPYSGSTKGAYAQSELGLFGAPYSTPANETFAGIDMVYYPWITQSWDFPTQNWTLDAMGYNPSCADYTGDGGLATFHSVGEKPGTASWYYSPMFDISTLEAPELSFYMYHTPETEGDAMLELYVSTGEGFNATGDVFRRDDATAKGWERHTTDLSAYKGCKSLRIAFKGIADGAADIYLDGIALASAKTDDAAITAFYGPARIGTGCTGSYSISVLNAGKKAFEGATLTVSEGETILFSTAVSAVPGTTAIVDAPLAFAAKGVHSLTAAIELASDDDASNNSFTLTVNAVEPIVPRPLNLSVSDNSGAVLTWDAPNAAGSVCDDFESYADYAISGIGEWTMYDGDNAPTYYINMSSVGEYPNAASAKAFQLINCRTLGIDIWEQGQAHSGDKLMAAMASIGYINDDWLISPMLNGSAQWISFYARSFTTDNIAPERMKVYTSAGGTNPASFTAITANYVELDDIWREYRYWMPEGTRHFAINCVSDDSFALFVDDARFNDMTVPAWEVTGYEVLRDGTVIATVETPGYTDAEATSGAVYTVRALYGTNGSSAESEAATYSSSTAEAPAVTGQARDEVFTPAGVKAGENARGGVFIIRHSDGTAEKRLIR